MAHMNRSQSMRPFRDHDFNLSGYIIWILLQLDQYPLLKRIAADFQALLQDKMTYKSFGHMQFLL